MSRCPIRRKFRFITTVILALPFWLCCYIQQAHSWAIQKTMSSKSFGVRMDTEGPPVHFATTWKRPVAFTAGSTSNKKSYSPNPSVAAASHKHGMPWAASIDERKPSDCTFMPFWEWQIDHFERHLSNFTIDNDHYVESDHKNKHDQKHVRMVTFSASSDEYRLIRMTYLDAGNQTQIFTSVAYPRGNLPILGCDFLSFQGGKRTLAIVDFQPIHDNNNDNNNGGGERQHDATYEHLLQPIRNAYKSLQEPMSDRFFDPSKFFSSQTLLGRFGLEDKPRLQSELMPAWQAYLQTHVGMAKQHCHHNTAVDVEAHHAAYDTYCLARDPAHPMFTSLFGPDFADDFLYNTMFPLAKRPAEEDEDDGVEEDAYQ